MKTCMYECIIMCVGIEFTKLFSGLYMTSYHTVDFYILSTYLHWGCNTAIFFKRLGTCNTVTYLVMIFNWKISKKFVIY